jgi:hypothetical protein
MNVRVVALSGMQTLHHFRFRFPKPTRGRLILSQRHKKIILRMTLSARRERRPANEEAKRSHPIQRLIAQGSGKAALKP